MCRNNISATALCCLEYSQHPVAAQRQGGCTRQAKRVLSPVEDVRVNVDGDVNLGLLFGPHNLSERNAVAQQLPLDGEPLSCGAARFKTQ